mmetsp:Transcript_33892/g.66680  ORF Transcript_33892/g.66680 Transcript_33892/m.66680 type:complete len:246 (-) Transcript_33892:1627-2364(-)
MEKLKLWVTATNGCHRSKSTAGASVPCPVLTELLPQLCRLLLLDGASSHETWANSRRISSRDLLRSLAEACATPILILPLEELDTFKNSGRLMGPSVILSRSGGWKSFPKARPQEVSFGPLLLLEGMESRRFLDEDNKGVTGIFTFIFTLLLFVGEEGTSLAQPSFLAAAFFGSGFFPSDFLPASACPAFSAFALAAASCSSRRFSAFSFFALANRLVLRASSMSLRKSANFWSVSFSGVFGFSA